MTINWQYLRFIVQQPPPVNGTLPDDAELILLYNINEGRILDNELIDDQYWSDLNLYFMRRYPAFRPSTWTALIKRRESTFCDQWDKVILKGIINASIHADFLRSPTCWKRISQVHSIHKADIPDGAWSQLCRIRGLNGRIPPGPYSS